MLLILSLGLTIEPEIFEKKSEGGIFIFLKYFFFRILNFIFLFQKFFQSKYTNFI
jgi:hypothetical protein